MIMCPGAEVVPSGANTRETERERKRAREKERERERERRTQTHTGARFVGRILLGSRRDRIHG